MKKNIGNMDRALRILLGLGLITWGLLTHNWIGAVGVVPLLTAFVRFCPAYLPFGLSTVGKNTCCGGGDCSRK